MKLWAQIGRAFSNSVWDYRSGRSWKCTAMTFLCQRAFNQSGCREGDCVGDIHVVWAHRPGFCQTTHHNPGDMATAIGAKDVFGHCLADVLGKTVERRLDVVELWSGVGSIARAAKAKSFAAETFDFVDSPDQNILKKDGFELALALVLQIREGGLLWLAPVCSSFCWLNLAKTKRSRQNNYVGDTLYPNVALGNAGAEIACFLFTVAWARGVEAVIENPPCSYLWKYPAIAELRSRMTLTLCTAIAYRCRFDPNPYGTRYLKGYKLCATGSWANAVGLKCVCPGRAHKRTYDQQGTAVTGRHKYLVATQAYPLNMGIAIVHAWCACGDQRPGRQLGEHMRKRTLLWQSSSDEECTSPSERFRSYRKGAVSQRAAPSESSGNEGVKVAVPSRRRTNACRPLLWHSSSSSED